MADMVRNKFAQMGVAVHVTQMPKPPRQRGVGRRWNATNRWGRGGDEVPVRVDVRQDAAGEYFDVRYRHDVRLDVIDVRRDDRHLVLTATAPASAAGNASDREERSTFLCGHDERSWFVAAIPESARVRNVQDAKDALKPQEVWDAMKAFRVPRSHRDRRRTAAFIRQGEWFFIPRPRLQVDASVVLGNEPIRRGAGKPHACQFLYRTSGTMVWVCDRFPNGLTEDEYQALSRIVRRKQRWTQMMRGARVYVKGSVRHPDHQTIWLNGWHEVVMNTETKARAMEHVAFLD